MVEADLNKENEEEPSFDDPEGYEDDISDDELVGDVLKQKPCIDEYEDCCIVIFGIPMIGKERVGKLGTVLKKVFDNISKDNNPYFPVDETGGTRGCCFVEWGDKTLAEFAKSALDGYKLDKNHTFTAILYSDIKKSTKPDENWKPPEPTPYNDVGDLWSWMQNNRCRDQFAVQYDKSGVPTVAVLWNIKGHDPEIVGDNAERPGWTESVFEWSPYGSFMTTIHKPGVILWGGPNFSRYQRFAHEGVQVIDFSPSENYLVTYAPSGGRWGDDDDVLRIWDVHTGEMKKGFSLYALTNREVLTYWPFFQWSQDEKYFACPRAPEKDKLEKEKKVNGISVFETETFDLLGRRSILIDNLKSFSWSPGRNVLAFYSEGEGDVPAEFGLLQIPSGQKVRTARIYNVAEAQMYWQKSGLRLAVHTLRYNKKVAKENGEVKYIGGTNSHIDIFDMCEKDVSLLNIPLKEPFVHFGWEPFGDKFCVLAGNSAKTTPFVYKIDPAKHQPLLMSKLEAGVQLNRVEWAPTGGWLAVLACLSTGGNVVFIDANGQDAKRTNVVEHPGFNEGVWDPTGRYFVTMSTVGGRAGADLGYRLYTFQGRELVRKNLERMVQFKWRPRPPVKLSDQKNKEIRKNLKTTSQKFDREDNEEKVKASQEVIDKRRKIMSAFEVIRQRNLTMIKGNRDQRIELRDGVDTDDRTVKEEDLVEEKITIALSTQKTRTTSGAEDEED